MKRQENVKDMREEEGRRKVGKQKRKSNLEDLGRKSYSTDSVFIMNIQVNFPLRKVTKMFVYTVNYLKQIKLEPADQSFKKQLESAKKTATGAYLSCTHDNSHLTAKKSTFPKIITLRAEILNSPFFWHALHRVVSGG